MTFGFDNVLAAYSFAAIIPLIVIYLIKPRPIRQAIPSLMFFIRRSKLSRKDTFFRHFKRDWLFILQLLSILLLAFTATEPYFSQNKDIVSGNTVFVLDVSASAKVQEGEFTRLALAKEKIRELAGEKSSLILARATPLIALQDESKGELLRALNRAEGTDEESNIGESILLAGEILEGRKGRVVVVSDFINTKGINTETAKNILISKGIPVDFINSIKGEKRNVGIIRLVPGEDAITIYVKNYNKNEEEVMISANGEVQPLTLKAESIETFLLRPQDAITEITLQVEDDFAVDNRVWVSKPNTEGIDILLITNNKSKFVQAAINSLEGVNLEIAEPPILPKDSYDVYFIHNIEKDKIIAGSFEDILQEVKQGASAIIHVQEESDKIDYNGLLAADIKNKSTVLGAITTEQVNKFTKDTDFGNIGTYFNIDRKDTVAIASVNGNPIITIKEEGNGVLVYYGILEKGSEFKISPSYPVFWTQMLKFLTKTPELDDINLKTGASVQLDDGSFLTLENTGLVEAGRQQIAVNLLNEDESDINPRQEKGKDIRGFILEPVKEDVKVKLFFVALILATVLVILEFAYTKSRGEI